MFVGEIFAFIADYVQAVLALAREEYAVAGDVKRGAEGAQHFCGDAIASVFQEGYILRGAVENFGQLFLGEFCVFSGPFDLQAHLFIDLVLHNAFLLPPCFKITQNRC